MVATMTSQTASLSDYTLFARHVLLPDGWHQDQRISIAGGKISHITTASPEPSDRVIDVLLPGMPDLHSHAFQRGMAGLAEVKGPGADSFWTWRQVMYRFLEKLTPDDLTAIATLAYIEMLESGFTRVGEFHYLHHAPDGKPYSQPAAMSDAIIDAAISTGINLTMLPVFYAHSGFGGQAPEAAQQRFIHSTDDFGKLYEHIERRLLTTDGAVTGVAPHSLRAVTAEELQFLTSLANGPVHIHIAEQMKEVNSCLAHYGARPVQWLLDNQPVNARWCLVHATHLDEAEISGIARSQAVAGLCPVTEANLGDGLFPLTPFLEAGGRIGVGSDSNVKIDAPEELRLLEYGQRLQLQNRNVSQRHAGERCGQSLWQQSVAGGAQALGVAPGLQPGACADMVSLKISGLPDMLRSHDNIIEQLVFCHNKDLIDCVWVNGRLTVKEGRHAGREHAQRAFIKTINRVFQ